MMRGTLMTEASAKSAGVVISIAAVIVIIYGMQAAKVLLVPFLLAAFLALITVRPMLWLQKQRVPSVLAALLIVSAMMFILAVVGIIVGSSIAEFTAALPAYQAGLDAIVQRALAFIGRFVDDDKSIASLGDLIDPGWAMGLAATILNGLRDVLTNTFLILFTMVFMLLEASSVEIKVRAAFGRGGESFQRPRIFLVNLGRYLGIKTLVSIVTGLVVGIMGDVGIPAELRAHDRIDHRRSSGRIDGAGATRLWRSRHHGDRFSCRQHRIRQHD